MGLRAKLALKTNSASSQQRNNSAKCMLNNNSNSSSNNNHKSKHSNCTTPKSISLNTGNNFESNDSSYHNSNSSKNNNNTNNNNKNATTSITTYRSSSMSALLVAAPGCSIRPQTLNVHNARETPTQQTQFFIGEVLNAWRAKARCNGVPAERTQELFHELSFNPSEKQIGEMLQTAKMLARKGSRQSNGLTFGEFCVLAADLKRFRTSTFQSPLCDKVDLLSSLQQTTDNGSDLDPSSTSRTNCNNGSYTGTVGSELRSTKSLSNVDDCMKISNNSKTTEPPVEVFLGGSCNPTTWRADVAIPALNELGISFYNPQVSDWTPDLIELEHRAKEKARVLFFVMDSETRASAGAIEAAHIAGQNCKQLVLVLHPYKPNQYILNEPISRQEFIDLMRNQLILKELVTRRGLPVLDDIPSGLQRTKEILAGIRDPPSNIASMLVVVRGAFDRVGPTKNTITLNQCQRALLYLGYAQSLVKLDNLNKIITSQIESLQALRNSKDTDKPFCVSSSNNISSTSTKSANNSSSSGSSSSNDNNSSSFIKTINNSHQQQQQPHPSQTAQNNLSIDFDLFCVISAYFSVLQQEIHESGCISPIKGTNLQPPPVYLANMQVEESYIGYSIKNISRTSSNNSVPNSSGSSINNDEFQNIIEFVLPPNRDSGTSSPQPQLDLTATSLKSRLSANLGKQQTTQILVNVESTESTQTSTVPTSTTPQNTTPCTQRSISAESAGSSLNNEEESDSNDSVFSSSSSINSVTCSGGALNYSSSGIDLSHGCGVDFRDVYLGGSCFLRTKWRQDVAMPYLKSKGVSFHLPALHESIQPSQLDLPESVFEEARNLGSQEREKCSIIRSRRKCRLGPTADSIETEVEQTTNTWTLSPMRPQLFNPSLLDSSRVLLFFITNETRSLAPMTLAAHCIGLMYNVVLAVQMLPENCVISKEKLTHTAIKDYNRGRSYLIDLAKRQGVPVFHDLKQALECVVDKVKACNSRNRSEL